MAARHVFGKGRVERGHVVRTCAKCGLRTRVVRSLPLWHWAEKGRAEKLYALPHKTEWTTTPRTCAEVRTGRMGS